MQPTAYVGVLVGLAFFTFCFWRRHVIYFKVSKGFPHPPGPSRKPLVGNLFDMSFFFFSRNLDKFLEWRRRYGDLVYVEALGNKLLFLNTIDVAADLLELRHNIYSDRPKFTMVGELMKLDLARSMPLLQYGEEWKRQRKFAHMALSTEAIKKYELVDDFVIKYIESLFDRPGDFERQLRLTVGRIVLSVTYGLPVNTPDDLYITDLERTMEMISKATIPGAFLVDVIPFLKYLPSWLPFNHIHDIAARGRLQIEALVARPYEHVKREREQGINRPSFTTECLDKYQSDDADVQASVEHTLCWAAGSMYGAGGEATYSATLNFMVALAMYPEVQEKLKKELFSVIGTDRLPKLQDRDSLPYLLAVIKEVMRWRPSLPFSIARVARKADFYKGYYIPEGTTVLPNVWAMRIDNESGFPSDEFIPERHMPGKCKETTLDPYTYTFGFGRRICPGRHLGDNMVFMLFSHIIATVNISRMKDANGSETPLTPTYSDGLVRYPRDFVVDIKPASKEAITVIKEKISRFA